MLKTTPADATGHAPDINSPLYWDTRFTSGDWENKGGRHQTFAFGELVLSACPAWLAQDIQQHHLSVCDWGCALGEATALWAARFPHSAVTGVDISAQAVSRAAHAYRNARFLAQDIATSDHLYDLVFSSNTLEHFDDPQGMLEILAQHSRRYLVLLLPFEEYQRLPEHRCTFDHASIRPTVGSRFVLAYFRVFELAGNPNAYWPGKQVMLIYVDRALLTSGAIPITQTDAADGFTLAPAAGAAVERTAAEMLKAGEALSRLQRAREQAAALVISMEQREESLAAQLENARAQNTARRQEWEEQRSALEAQLAQQTQRHEVDMARLGAEMKAALDAQAARAAQWEESARAQRHEDHVRFAALLSEQAQRHQAQHLALVAEMKAARYAQRVQWETLAQEQVARQMHLDALNEAIKEERRSRDLRMEVLQQEKQAQRQRIEQLHDEHQRALHEQGVAHEQLMAQEHQGHEALAAQWGQERVRLIQEHAQQFAAVEARVAQLVAAQASAAEEMRRLIETRGLKHRMKAATIRMLRGTYHALPLPRTLRLRAKAAFYSVFGRFYPRSFWYRRYLDSKVFEVPASTPAPAPVGAPPAMKVNQPCDIIVFPVIDWFFRRQRPQHLAMQLAKQGHRVWYLTTTFERSAQEPREVADNVWTLTLPCPGTPPIIYNQLLDEAQLSVVVQGIEDFRRQTGDAPVVCIVQHPFWTAVAAQLTNSSIVYDCMDHHAGFSNTGDHLAALEGELLRRADLVLASSRRLYDSLAPRARRCVLLPNAAEFAHFATPPAQLAFTATRPVIGYYGAIAEWFDVDLVTAVARAMPDCDFVLVGSTVGSDTMQLEALPNVRMVGEVPYAELAGWVHAFDVCMIPFRVNELTLCTNPVKVYEYFSAAKPVVATALPELVAMRPLVRVAGTADEFVAVLRESLAPASDLTRGQRQDFARANTWEQRGQVLAHELQALAPKISVIVLTHNQLQFTQACLESLDRFTHYPNWELIIVDNASQDGTREFLRDYAAGRPHVHLVFQETNTGFAGGNNAGARVATGDYLVLLNNDTYVTSGWLGTLLGHLRRDPGLGLIGPVTNNIGNEARIPIAYADMAQMAAAAALHTRAQRGRTRPMDALAFFCVMIPRTVWNQVGELDPAYQLGFFEDDDYSIRVRRQGYRSACAEDVFVHHHLSASFGVMSEAQRDRLFAANRAYYESKWGPWTPHCYRSLPQ